MNIETKAILFVSRLAPWLATLPTAWAIGQAVGSRLEWPALVAAIVGVAVETLGVASASTALELWGYQRAKRKSDPDAPVMLGVGIVGLYFASVLVLTVLLEGNWLLAVFPFLSMAAVGNMALRLDHAARLAGIESDRAQTAAERAAERAQKRADAAQKQPSAAEILAEFRAAAQATAQAPQAAEAAAQAAAQRVYACEICGAEFAKQTSFAAHKRIHRNGHGGNGHSTVETVIISKEASDV